MNQSILENIVSNINNMDKIHHIELLRIIKKQQPTLLISENSNGSFLNMNELTNETIDEIQIYLNLHNKREEELNIHETMKNTIIETYLQQ